MIGSGVDFERRTARDRPDDGPSDAAATTTDDVDPTDRLAAETRRHVRRQPWVCDLVRAGWVAKGAVYATMGYAALLIATGRAGATTDAEYTGIVTSLASHSAGRVALLLIAVGLALYVAFRVLSVALIDDDDADAWAHRVAYLFSAATYAGVGTIAVVAAVRGGREDGESLVQRISLTLLESGLGRLLLAGGAVVALGIACYFVIKGLTRRFLRDVDTDEPSPVVSRIIVATGVLGWTGRGLIVGAVAFFALRAAWRAERSEAEGLDSSLHRIADSSGGTILVFATAALLLTYALYCLASTPYRRLAWDDDPDPDDGPNPLPDPMEEAR